MYTFCVLNPILLTPFHHLNWILLLSILFTSFCFQLPPLASFQSLTSSVIFSSNPILYICLSSPIILYPTLLSVSLTLSLFLTLSFIINVSSSLHQFLSVFLLLLLSLSRSPDVGSWSGGLRKPGCNKLWSRNFNKFRQIRYWGRTWYRSWSSSLHGSLCQELVSLLYLEFDLGQPG